MLEIITENGSLDLYHDEQFKYNIQVADIFNLSASKSSYVDSLSVPKTANNVSVFKGLGLVGDTSNVPYSKISIQVKYSGYVIINQGWLEVSEVTDEYKIKIIDGIIDFFKAIEGKKIGLDLDLSASNHEKTTRTVIDSQNNNIYRYLVADYGGKNETEKGAVNIDYLTPSLSPYYLLTQIQNYTGFTFFGSILNHPDFTDVWWSYPKAPEEGGAGEVLVNAAELSGTKIPINTNKRVGVLPLGKNYLVGGDNRVIGDFSFTETNVISGNLKQIEYFQNYSNESLLVKNTAYIVQETGTYKFTLNTNILVRTKLFVFNPRQDAPFIEINVNGSPVEVVKAGYLETSEEIFYRNLNKGDEIVFKYYIVTTFEFDFISYIFYQNDVLIQKSNLGNVSFTDALKDYLITDWFKDFLWRYGLTAIANNQDKTINLQAFNEKIIESNAVDWSDKFVKRISENSNIPTFGQNSMFTHKYNNEFGGFNDGTVYVNNVNLDESKVVIASKMYSAENYFNFLLDTEISLPVLPVWQKEVKANRNNEIEVSYKSLSDRFYYAKAERINGSIQVGSDVLNEQFTMSNYNIANVSGVHFNSLVPNYYSKQSQLLNVFKAHTIELNLSLFDLINLDLSKIYYFSNEGQYYLLNKLSWSPNKISVGEFVRVIV